MNLDFYGILHVAPRTEAIKYVIYLLEGYLALAAKTGANQVIGIIDLEGFNIRHYTHRLGNKFYNTVNLRLSALRLTEVTSASYI